VDRANVHGHGTSVGSVEVDQVITCIDCGGRAHLISYPPSERDWQPGDLAVYRCEDCLDRWDLLVGDDDDHPHDP
jgi:hypothetical protein